MKCLAIADLFINAAMMESGLKALRDNGIEVEVREWSHGSVEKLQEDHLRVEQEGAEAVADFLKQIAPLLERGLLELCCQDQGNARVRIPPGRLFVSDDIIRDCLLPV